VVILPNPELSGAHIFSLPLSINPANSPSLEDFESEIKMSYWEEALNESMGRLGSVSAKNSTADKSDPTFTCFSKLPIELRLKIWKEALPGPRVIKLKFSDSDPWEEEDESDSRICAIAKTPAILGANHESRQVAPRFYELSFDSILEERPVYIDYRVDALYIDVWDVFKVIYKRNFRFLDSTSAELGEIESRLRCLVLGRIDSLDRLKPSMMRTLQNLDSLFLHFKGPSYRKQKLTEDDRRKFMRDAGATKKFARDVGRVWKANSSGDEEMPRIQYVNDEGHAIKVQSWEVRAVIFPT
jgi:hypothetical protein